MAEAIKTKVAIKQPGGSIETAERVLLALTEDEAVSLLMVCGGICSPAETTRRGHFDGKPTSINRALKNAGVTLPGGEDYDCGLYYGGAIMFKVQACPPE